MLDENEQLQIAVANEKKCFVHPERAALKFATIPCAPDGGFWICCECSDDIRIPFEHYRKSHAKNIQAFRQTNPNS